jgi:Na+(H+)/acetate symporter ActP
LVNEIGAVELSFVNLTLGVTYQLQVSADLQNWYTAGLPFTATTNTMAYPLYFGVDFWNQLFFRLQVSP